MILVRREGRELLPQIQLVSPVFGPSMRKNSPSTQESAHGRRKELKPRQKWESLHDHHLKTHSEGTERVSKGEAKQSFVRNIFPWHP